MLIQMFLKTSLTSSLFLHVNSRMSGGENEKEVSCTRQPSIFLDHKTLKDDESDALHVFIHAPIHHFSKLLPYFNNTFPNPFTRVGPKLNMRKISHFDILGHHISNGYNFFATIWYQVVVGVQVVAASVDHGKLTQSNAKLRGVLENIVSPKILAKSCKMVPF